MSTEDITAAVETVTFKNGFTVHMGPLTQEKQDRLNLWLRKIFLERIEEASVNISEEFREKMMEGAINKVAGLTMYSVLGQELLATVEGIAMFTYISSVDYTENLTYEKLKQVMTDPVNIRKAHKFNAERNVKPLNKVLKDLEETSEKADNRSKNNKGTRGKKYKKRRKEISQK